MSPAAPVMRTSGAIRKDAFLARQFAVANAVWLIGFLAQSLLPVRFILAVVPFEPGDLAVAFERHNVGRDPVQKPAIVTADDGAACETFQSFFERAQGVDIEIVGRLVEDDEVRPLFQHTGQVHPVAFAAGDVLHLLLLIGAREVEPGAVGPGVDFGLAEHNGLVALGDDLVDGFVRLQAAILVHVAQLDRLTNLARSRIRFLYPDDHPEHRRLTGSVRTDHADNAAFGKTEVHILIEDLVPISFADALGFDDHIAQPWARRDVDLQICSLFVLSLIDQIFIAVEPRLALRLTGFRRHPVPGSLGGRGLPGASLRPRATQFSRPAEDNAARPWRVRARFPIPTRLPLRSFLAAGPASPGAFPIHRE